jgi:hypothetical protein
MSETLHMINQLLLQTLNSQVCVCVDHCLAREDFLSVLGQVY